MMFLCMTLRIFVLEAVNSKLRYALQTPRVFSQLSGRSFTVLEQDYTMTVEQKMEK